MPPLDNEDLGTRGTCSGWKTSGGPGHRHVRCPCRRAHARQGRDHARPVRPGGAPCSARSATARSSSPRSSLRRCASCGRRPASGRRRPSSASPTSASSSVRWSCPGCPDGEFRASLAFQVQDFIPMPVDQAILDYHPLEEFAGDNGARMLRVLLVAASRDMIGNALKRSSWPACAPPPSTSPASPCCAAWSPTARSSVAPRPRRSSTSARASPTSWCTRAASRASSASC